MTGIVLAGGKSSRMGEDKGLMTLKGRPMISYVLEALRKQFEDIIIIANDPVYEDFGYPVFPDLLPNKGPLAGIYTGLLKSENHLNFVTSCDVPFITTELISYLIGHVADYDVTVPRHLGGTEQLMGVYTKKCIPVFEERIHKGKLKIKEASRLLNYQEIQIDQSHPFFDPKMFLNVNRHEDFEQAKKS